MSDAVESVMARATARVGATLRGRLRLEALIGVSGIGRGLHRRRTATACGAPSRSSTSSSASTTFHPAIASCARATQRTASITAAWSACSDDDVADDGSVFLVMELLRRADEWSTRWPLRAEGGVLGPRRDARYGRSASRHPRRRARQGRRPPRPQARGNLFFTNDGEVKVLDFGDRAPSKGLAGGERTNDRQSRWSTPRVHAAGKQASRAVEPRRQRAPISPPSAQRCSRSLHRPVQSTSASDTSKLLAAAMTQPARSIRALAPNIPARGGSATSWTARSRSTRATRWANAHADAGSAPERGRGDRARRLGGGSRQRRRPRWRPRPRRGGADARRGVRRHALGGRLGLALVARRAWIGRARPPGRPRRARRDRARQRDLGDRAIRGRSTGERARRVHRRLATSDDLGVERCGGDGRCRARRLARGFRQGPRDRRIHRRPVAFPGRRQRGVARVAPASASPATAEAACTAEAQVRGHPVKGCRRRSTAQSLDAKPDRRACCRRQRAARSLSFARLAAAAAKLTERCRRVVSVYYGGPDAPSLSGDSPR